MSGLGEVRVGDVISSIQPITDPEEYAAFAAGIRDALEHIRNEPPVVITDPSEWTHRLGSIGLASDLDTTK
jgi:hypothetical protein